MKTILHLFTGALLLCSVVVQAQQFSPTTGVPCPNCVPANYNAIGTPFISDIYNPGIDVTKNDYQWYIYMGELDPVPSTYSQGLPAGAGKNSFVSLKTSEGTVNDKLYIDVGGFDVNKTYIFKYSVCGNAIYQGSASQAHSPDAESATMEISTVGLSPNVLIASQTTDFVNPTIQQHWTTRVISFKPLSATIRFRLSGKTPGQTPGYVHFSIDKYPFDCSVLTPKQVELTKSIVETPFNTGKLDLATVPIKSVAPAGAELVWKASPNSTEPTLTAQQAASVGISNQGPMNIKPYYAFYYAKDLNCPYASVSQAELKFMYTPKQVTLKQTNITVSCDQPTTDLTALVDNPLGSVLWYTNNTRSGLAFSDPASAPAGDYYAFYFDSQGLSYSLPNGQVSTAHVKVENPIMPGIPDLGPLMNINSLFFPQNGSKDFVIKIVNKKSENSNCSVFFKVSKLPGFTITYSTQAGTSNVGNGVGNNNDFWTFTENGQYITVTSKNGIAADGYSFIGFKITRNGNTSAGTAQNLSVSIAPGGGGGETNTTNNQTITTLTAVDI